MLLNVLKRQTLTNMFKGQTNFRKQSTVFENSKQARP